MSAAETPASAEPNTTSAAPRIVVLVAHGSRSPLAGEEHLRLCAAVQAEACRDSATPVEVRPAFLELAEPSIPVAIDAAVADGAVRIRLLPHFLNSGNHVLRDLPSAVAEANERHPGVEIELAERLGADPGLVELLTRRVLAD